MILVTQLLRHLKGNRKIMIKKQLTIGQVIARFNHAKSAMNLNAIKHISYNLIDNTVAYLLEYKKVKETRLEAKEIDYIISLLYKCHVHKVAGMLYS